MPKDLKCRCASGSVRRRAPRFGAVAQLGERRVRNAKVEGSTPFRSTYPLLCKGFFMRVFAGKISLLPARLVVGKHRHNQAYVPIKINSKHSVGRFSKSFRRYDFAANEGVQHYRLSPLRAIEYSQPGCS